MKSLYESLLDDFDTLNSKIDPKKEIEQFIEDNYVGRYKISDKPNKDGLYEVSGNSIGVKNGNTKLTSLTNGLFVWSEVKSFDCSYCSSLKILEGAPKKVSNIFYCVYCDSLTSLEGAPEEVRTDFICTGCNSLTSLKGAPKEVGRDFCCDECSSLTSLKGAPEKVVGWFDCSNCNSLTSLKGAPKKVGGNFSCKNCKNKFTAADIIAVSNVKGEMRV